MPIYLKILQGPSAGQALAVPPGAPVTLGRSSSASYAFDDPLLSRKHCAVEVRAEFCRIVDLRSRNGTYVNGQQIGAILVQPGDRIKIGSVILEVSNSPTGEPSNTSFTGGVPPGVGVGATQIEGFEIINQLEVTSFGATFLARQLLMDRTVILKTIETGPETDETTLKRFMREAKAGGKLTHPQIVELYDVNEQDGLLYLVTEYVEGYNLGKVLSERGGQPLPAGPTLRVLFQIGEALAYAHGKSIIHRDVRPHHVLVRAKDHLAKLQGFALAKNLQRAISVITADGESLGTPYYMPPEQVRSAKDADERSDLYAWAATTYHCLSGRLPLESRSYGEFIDKVFTCDPEPLQSLVPTCPRELSDLLGRCMEREADARPDSMKLVLQALEPIVRALG
ncbi:MAG: protein kinase [Planctomycetes bacterium]|nr:protein kinase [Planctomycetota bacterium]